MAQDEAVCIFQNSSHLAQHVVHNTWVDQHICTWHSHSFLSIGTTYFKFLDRPFWRDEPLPRSTTREYRLYGWSPTDYSFAAHPNRDSSDECCISTNSSWIGCLSPVCQISEVVLAICFQLPHRRSLEFVPKNSFLAASHFWVAVRSPLLRTSPRSTRWDPESAEPALHTSLTLLRRSWADLLSELIVRTRRSVLNKSALKCMVSLLFFLFRIPQLKALMLLNFGV